MREGRLVSQAPPLAAPGGECHACFLPREAPDLGFALRFHQSRRCVNLDAPSQARASLPYHDRRPSRTIPVLFIKINVRTCDI